MSDPDALQLSKNEEKIDLENWMSNLPHKLWSLPIISLSIPGSHNSFSYNISSENGVSPDTPSFVRLVSKLCPPITKRIILNWSRTQDVDILKQLISGVRYFDFRVVVKNSQIYVAHGLYGNHILTYLEVILSFLSTHKREIVVLDFQHFYNFEINHHFSFVEMLKNLFGSRIMPNPNNHKEIWLERFWSLEKQVIIIYRNRFTLFDHLFWPSVVWKTPWPNKIKVDDLFNYLDNELMNKNCNLGLVTQCILTPTIKYILFRLCGNLKNNLSVPCNKKLIPWLQSRKGGPCGVNVVICDFVLSDNLKFVETVIYLNYKLIEGNVKVGWAEEPHDSVL